MSVAGSTFFDRIDELDIAVGHGLLTLAVEINQIYAHYQEVGDDFEHPRGGEARALRNSLFVKIDQFMEIYARSFITETGSDVIQAAKDIAENISFEYYDRAPREFDDLRDSGHPTVTDDGVVIYDRAPRVGRLTAEQLREKSKLRDEGLGNHYAKDKWHKRTEHLFPNRTRRRL